MTNQKRITNPGGVRVLFNGIPAPLVFASAGQAIGDCAVWPLEQGRRACVAIEDVP